MIRNIINNSFGIKIRKNCIHIIHFKNIIDISSKRIDILLDNCRLVIKGSCLIIKAMDEYEVLINGIIEGIDFINE